MLKKIKLNPQPNPHRPSVAQMAGWWNGSVTAGGNVVAQNHLRVLGRGFELRKCGRI
jgi:hypothetical protein